MNKELKAIMEAKKILDDAGLLVSAVVDNETADQRTDEEKMATGYIEFSPTGNHTITWVIKAKY